MNLFIYLLRRDRKSVRIISILNGTSSLQKITTVKNLNLPKLIETQIEKIINENKMMWQAWMESANNIQSLITSLSSRGYKQLPCKLQPEIRETATADNLNLKKINLGILSS